ncbi:hypothetical protein AYK26_02510 [Euryarchaeota archaeon SM23-78]|nr:MAG: hypothetical protein AYK26_02510 [Euryarchaeota archaeon SM23-78]MBW3000245.1 hypothetical protein [Candidatus Woesearchaeota archaeon]
MIDEILLELRAKDKLGIHENDSCARCGACCIYFDVRNDDGSMHSKAGEICPDLDYDFNTNIATCTLYNDKRRPSECKNFDYCSLDHVIFLVEGGKHWEGLKETAKRMPTFFKK